MTTPAERQFAVFRRGELREEVLRGWRNGLRALIDPETGQIFTEDKIRLATGFGTRFYTEADSIDVIGLGIQKRDEFFAQQVRIDRAGSAFLRNFHAPQWGEQPLLAAGGSGPVLATGNAGTPIQGSTTVPDPLAVRARDPAGNLYQVFVGGTLPASGQLPVTLIGVDGGAVTNLASGTTLTWENAPPGLDNTAETTAAFTGGVDAETDQQFADRLAARIRHKPASGNWSHFRQFARASTNSVEDAFIYPAAFHAGSVLVCITQKRGSVVGPSARVANLGTLALATAFLTPPASPVIPARVFVLVVTVQLEPTNMVLQLAQPKNSAAGWTDLEPFPPVGAAGTEEATITTVTSQTDIDITTTAGAGQLPGGVAGPLAGVSLMVWNGAISAFESLDVASVTDSGGGVYNVLLNNAPTKTLASGDFISPDMARRASLASSIVSYFDELGPGEVVDLNSDIRSSYAFRNPVTSEEFPSRAGQAIITRISDGLGSALADAQLQKNTVPTPSLPADISDGPNLIVAGNMAVYDLP